MHEEKQCQDALDAVNLNGMAKKEEQLEEIIAILKKEPKERSKPNIFQLAEYLCQSKFFKE